MIYQENKKFSMRRDGEIYISMASEIYDVPGAEKVELPDGTKKEVQVMQAVVDEESGEVVILNDLRMAEFEVTSRITASYTSQKEQTLDRLEAVLAGMAPDDPMRKAMQLKIIQLSDGVEMEDLKEFANKQLVLSGIKTPETDEEKELLAQAQAQPQEPDAAMVLAKAEELKGQADIMKVKKDGIEMQLTDANDKSKLQIDVFKAQTERMKVEVAAHEAGAKIAKTELETEGIDIDNEIKILEFQQPKKVEDMDDDELFGMIATG
jgi:hypothetical protein